LAKFRFIETGINGLFTIETEVFNDSRGFFMEVYNYKEFKAAGFDTVFVQDNHTVSRKGALRGMHFQNTHPQDKLVRVVYGRVFDVAVDLRHESLTYGKWHGEELSADNKRQMYIPKGFAHGFLTLSEESVLAYKCSDFYMQEDEGGIIWNDPGVGIQWPLNGIGELIISDKDKALDVLQIL